MIAERVERAGGFRRESTIVGNADLLIESERALMVASGYLAEQDMTLAAQAVIRYLLRRLVSETIDGILRLPGEAGVLLFPVPCGIAASGDPDSAYDLASSLASIAGADPEDASLAGFISSIVTRVSTGQEPRGAVSDELRRRGALLSSTVTQGLQWALDLTDLGSPSLAALLEPSGVWVRDVAIRGLTAAMLYPTSFGQGVQAAAGKISDRVAPAAIITGALLGAWIREDGIPAEWLTDLQSRQEALRVTTSLCRTFDRAGVYRAEVYSGERPAYGGEAGDVAEARLLTER